MRYDVAADMKEILLVEDNAGDVMLLTDAFEQVNAQCRVTTVSDGVAAIDHLLEKASRKLAPLPDLVLLDLNLPRRNGHETLAEIRSNPGLKRIPTVILSSSRSREDVRKSLDLGANAYLSKPNDPLAYRDLARAIDAFWLRLAVNVG